jgi:hypothetical protein
MEKATKLEEQELKQLHDFQQESEILISQLGQINFQKLQLEKQEEFLKQKFNELTNKELEISQVLKEKYGNVNIDLKTGELTYS